jgi:hypothetical protein
MWNSDRRSRSKTRKQRRHRKRSREDRRDREESRSRSRADRRSRSPSEDRSRERGSSRTSSAVLGDSALLEKVLEQLQKQGQKITSLESEVKGRAARSPTPQPQEEPTALESRGTEPGKLPCRPFFYENWQRGGLTDGSSAAPKFTLFPSVIVDRSVTFATPEPEQDAGPSLVNQLFGSQDAALEGVSWDPTILTFAKSTVQAALRGEYAPNCCRNSESRTICRF